MKPYIMQYSESIQKQEVYNTPLDSTLKTFTIESDDDDSIQMGQWTTITKTSEASDEDSIFIPLSTIKSSLEEDKKNNRMSTMFTESSENNDDDYIFLSTMVTNVTENQDDDYIY
jgi:hypothetical protein